MPPTRLLLRACGSNTFHAGRTRGPRRRVHRAGEGPVLAGGLALRVSSFILCPQVAKRRASCPEGGSERSQSVGDRWPTGQQAWPARSGRTWVWASAMHTGDVSEQRVGESSEAWIPRLGLLELRPGLGRDPPTPTPTPSAQAFSQTWADVNPCSWNWLFHLVQRSSPHVYSQ